MKICSKCNKNLSLSKYNYKDKARDKLQAQCRKCSNAQVRKHYRDNKPYYRKKNATRKTNIRELIIKLKDVPCKDCNRRFPHYVMDFDHLHNKKFNLGKAAERGLSEEKIIEEANKCEIVCSNCHRERTYGQRGN